MVHVLVLDRSKVFLLVFVTTLVSAAMVSAAMVYGPMYCDAMVGEVCVPMVVVVVCVGMSWRQSDSWYPMVPC